MAMVTVDLPSELEQQLRTEAARSGMSLPDWIRELLERAARPIAGSRTDAPGMTAETDKPRAHSPTPPAADWQARLAALVDEFRSGVAEAGAAGEDVSPEALEDAMTEAREARRRERRAARAGRH